jgi:hypothetical protein
MKIMVNTKFIDDISETEKQMPLSIPASFQHCTGDTGQYSNAKGIGHCLLFFNNSCIEM